MTYNFFLNPRSFLLSLLVFLTTPLLHAEEATTAALPEAAIDINNPEHCSGCHETIVSEWKESMHSHAHREKDPIFARVRKMRMKKEGDTIAKKCVKCHNSRDPKNPDSPAGKAGVSCASCHNVKAVHPGPHTLGVEALEWEAPGVLRSARDLVSGLTPAHGTGPALPAHKDGVTLCLACHNVTHTPSGTVACMTGPEYFQSSKSEQTCVSCHMPEIASPGGVYGRKEAHRSHQFLGPHRAWYQDDTSILEQAVDLSLRFKEKTVVVRLKNKSAHSFPSGYPGRMAILKVEGRDERGKVIWKNFAANPLKESPQSVLNKVYHNAEGKPVPPPFSTSLVRDTRLVPDEERELSYTDIPSEVRTVTAILLFRLLPPKLAEKLGLSEAKENRTVQVMQKTVTR
jgi:hypothetical protein